MLTYEAVVTDMGVETSNEVLRNDFEFSQITQKDANELM